MSVQSAAARSDGVGLFDGDDEHPSVTLLTGSSGLDHRFHDVIDNAVGNDQIDHHFVAIRNLVLAATKHGGGILPTSASPDVGDREARHVEMFQGISRRFDLGLANDAFHQLHGSSPVRSPDAASRIESARW